MKIVLTSAFGYGSARMSEPIGLLYLKSYLNSKGYNDIIIIEPFENGESMKEIAQKIVKINPEVLGISAMIEKNIDNVIPLVNLIHDLNCTPFIILGGHAISLYNKYNELGAHYLLNYVSCIIRGEGEIPMYSIIESLENKKIGKQLRV